MIIHICSQLLINFIESKLMLEAMGLLHNSPFEEGRFSGVEDDDSDEDEDDDDEEFDDPLLSEYERLREVCVWTVRSIAFSCFSWHDGNSRWELFVNNFFSNESRPTSSATSSTSSSSTS